MNDASIDDVIDRGMGAIFENAMAGVGADFEVRHMSWKEAENPFYVIVHEYFLHDGETRFKFWPKRRIERELREIKRRFEYREVGPTVDWGVAPEGRTVLVAGLYEDACVKWAYKHLRLQGHDAYISREGVISTADVKPDR
jgi:hypothetical protein